MEHPYAIGDTAYIADIERAKETVTCPDCLGDKVATATTRAGEEYKINCTTCHSMYESHGRIESSKSVPLSRMVSICRVTAETNKTSTTYQYMASETSDGNGSGSVYSEDRIFDNRADATAAAQKQIDGSQATVDKSNLVSRRKDARRKYKAYQIDDIRELFLAKRDSTADEIYLALTGYKLRPRKEPK